MSQETRQKLELFARYLGKRALTGLPELAEEMIDEAGSDNKLKRNIRRWWKGANDVGTASKPWLIGFLVDRWPDDDFDESWWDLAPEDLRTVLQLQESIPQPYSFASAYTTWAEQQGAHNMQRFQGAWHLRRFHSLGAMVRERMDFTPGPQFSLDVTYVQHVEPGPNRTYEGTMVSAGDNNLAIVHRQSMGNFDYAIFSFCTPPEDVRPKFLGGLGMALSDAGRAPNATRVILERIGSNDDLPVSAIEPEQVEHHIFEPVLRNDMPVFENSQTLAISNEWVLSRLRAEDTKAPS